MYIFVCINRHNVYGEVKNIYHGGRSFVDYRLEDKAYNLQSVGDVSPKIGRIGLLLSFPGTTHAQAIVHSSLLLFLRFSHNGQ